MNVILAVKRIYRKPRELLILRFTKAIPCNEKWLIEIENFLAPTVVVQPATWSKSEKIRIHENLNEGGDKMSASRHGYAKVYASILKDLPEKGSLLEVGVFTGVSLGIWSQAKPNWNIFGLDIDLDRFNKNYQYLQNKGCFKNSVPRCEIFDCYNPEVKTLEKMVENLDNKEFNLIIDDGPHTNEAILSTFKSLFPYLSKNGVYVIEDNLSVKKELKDLSQKFNAKLERRGDLLIVRPLANR